MPDRPPYHRQTLRVSRTLIPMLSKSLFLSVPMAPAPRDVSFSQADASAESYEFLDRVRFPGDHGEYREA